MTTRLQAARAWVEEVHPHARHLLRTEHWLLQLQPGASEALRLAAVLHDIERAFPDTEAGWDSSRDAGSADYNRWHQDRCAEIAARWLGEHGASDALVEEVAALIRVHEDGGWPEADLLQAADSLSFLDTMVPLVQRWPRAAAEAKLDHSVERINPALTRARELAEPMREAGLQAVAG
jgi:malate synthase